MQTVISALARSIIYTPPNKQGTINTRRKFGDNKFKQMCEKMELSIKQAFCEFPNYGEVCKILMQIGDEHELLSKSCRMRVCIPVKPMLAMPTNGV